MSNSILGNAKIANIVKHARSVRERGVRGIAMEVGVYKGGVLAEIASVFDRTRRVIGYDTFAGLPAVDHEEGEHHRPGEFGDTSLRAVGEKLAGTGVLLVPGYFPETAIDTPIIAFAHVDVDFYRSTRNALQWILPRLAPGGVIVIDDYDWPHCPGVRKAIDELRLPVKVEVQYQAVYQ
jgi:hypothetical protein